jgi:hypothetical protein
MGLVVMPVFAIALALGVGGVVVGPNHTIANVFAIHIEDDETLGSAKMVGDRYSVYGSDCDLHAFSLSIT